MFFILGILPGIVEKSVTENQVEIAECVTSKIKEGATKEWALGYCDD